MPSKRVIVLERHVDQERAWGDQSPQFWSYVLWADVPASRQTFYAKPGFVSAVQGISAADLTALQNGSVVERQRILSVDKGTTNAQLMTKLELEWTQFQSQVNAFNPWNRYGTFWDGTTWTAGGVA